MNNKVLRIRCLDCSFQENVSLYPCSISFAKEDGDGSQREWNEVQVCQCWTPEHWVEKGFERGWARAAGKDLTDGVEVLRKMSDYEVRYVILAPLCLDRPMTFFAQGEVKYSWGNY